MHILNKIYLGFKALLGYIYKCLVDLRLIDIPSLNSKKCVDIVVSITSYGRRVSSSVIYYTLVSVLRQTNQPKRIILWLDKLKWSETTLPSKLLSLKGKGIEFKFCDDVKSYTKLVPSLMNFHNETILTLDDDIIYSSHTIEQLADAHKTHPNDICCLQALKMHCHNGVPINYHEWKEYTHSFRGNGAVFPLGVGGILYPPHCLCQDVVCSDLFMSLCPQADDIWFWLCGLRNNTIISVVKKNGKDLSFDSLYQYFHKGTALTHSNRFENMNDRQFKAVMNYYNLHLIKGKLVKIYP